jgi:hypothetical protein
MGTATNQGLTVKFGGSDVGQVAGGSFDDSMTQVDCTTLDDDQVDNRSDLLDPSGTLIVSLKDSNDPGISLDDIGTLQVGDLSRNVRISSISQSADVGGHRTLTFSFVSTEETSGT